MLLFVLPLLIGCGDRTKMPYLGKWTGTFDAEHIAGSTPVKDLKRNTLKGYIQLYATNLKAELHLEGEQFAVNSKGTWEIKGDRITYQATEVKVDDGGGEELRDPNKAWISPVELRTAYSRPLTLKVSKDKKSLMGILLTVGPIDGTHRFVKDGFGR